MKRTCISFILFRIYWISNRLEFWLAFVEIPDPGLETAFSKFLAFFSFLFFCRLRLFKLKPEISISYSKLNLPKKIPSLSPFSFSRFSFSLLDALEYLLWTLRLSVGMLFVNFRLKRRGYLAFKMYNLRGRNIPYHHIHSLNKYIMFVYL